MCNTNNDSANIKRHIDAILDNTIKVLRALYKWQKDSTREAPKTGIRFPQYRDEQNGNAKAGNPNFRISEQELRFVFVEQFNKYVKESNWDAYYSVETPTKARYNFTGKTNNCRSANIDLTIHDADENRLCLIEFKKGNPRSFCHQKDLLKLRSEPKGIVRYFIEMVESTQKGTFNNIKSKFNLEETSCKVDQKEGEGDYPVQVIVFALNHEESLRGELHTDTNKNLSFTEVKESVESTK